MRRKTDYTLALAFLLLVACAIPSFAGGPGEIPSKPNSDEDEQVAQETTNETDYTRHWYLSVGASNYHPKLEESEAKIDNQVNSLFGVLPRWKKPTTFADWRDDWKLWDLTVGVGRDITPRTSWMLWVGGATGTIRTHERYGVFGSLGTDVRCTRTTGFLTLEGYVYPLGKPDFKDESFKNPWDRAKGSLAGTKPYLALATGYSFVRAKGDVRVDLPIVDRIFRQKDVEDHHMYQVSPRLGFETPLSEDSTFFAEGTYYFFGPDHEDEYNGASVCLGFKRRF